MTETQKYDVTISGSDRAGIENDSHTAQKQTIFGEQNAPRLNLDGKAALQELLKFGSIEQHSKPNMYRSLNVQLSAVNRALAPLDLMAQLDDIRGIVFIKIAPADELNTTEAAIEEYGMTTINGSTINGSSGENQFDTNDISDTSIDTHTEAHTDLQTAKRIQAQADEEWSHPLVRKQRLTLEQSLLLAILRQRFIEGEQQHGIGAANIIAELDDLQSQLQVYTGSSGSDSSDERRLRTLLDQLASHGVVSKVDANDEVTIRPLIAHIANPENLSRLLKQVTSLSSETRD